MVAIPHAAHTGCAVRSAFICCTFTPEIYFVLQYPEKPADLTSETLTEWLYKFYELNKNFETNYSDKSNRYGLIKTDVAV